MWLHSAPERFQSRPIGAVRRDFHRSVMSGFVALRSEAQKSFSTPPRDCCRRAAVGWQKLRLDEARAHRDLARPEHAPGPWGASAQGYAADEALRILKGRGIDPRARGGQRRHCDRESSSQPARLEARRCILWRGYQYPPFALSCFTTPASRPPATPSNSLRSTASAIRIL